MRNSQVFPQGRALLLNSIATRIFFRMLWLFFLISISATVVSVPSFLNNCCLLSFMLFSLQNIVSCDSNWVASPRLTEIFSKVNDTCSRQRTEFGQYRSTVHCLIPMVTSHNETGKLLHVLHIPGKILHYPHINFPCTSTIGASSPANSPFYFL